jgi:rod shape-determining protein MreC
MAMMDRRGAGRSRITLALLIITTIAVLTLDFRDVPALDGVRHGVSAVVRPFRGAAEFVATPFQNAWHGIADYPEVSKDNRELRERVDELEGTRDRNASVAESYDELSSLLDIDWVGSTPTVAAQVISEPASSFSHVIEINKGTSSNIEVGMPVVNGAGLVGKVIDVTAGRASVQLVTDPDFRVGVRIVDGPANAIGIAQGRGSGQDLLVDTGLEPGVDAIAEDALFTTSGIDERAAFPGSIPVGRVSQVRPASGGLSTQFLITPTADLGSLGFVSVMRWRPAE